MTDGDKSSDKGGPPPPRKGDGRRSAGPSGKNAGAGPRRAGGLRLRSIGDGFEFVHPRCVEEMELDYVEGIEIWKAGEPEEARDALRYALQGCGDNLWVHVALGRIALEASRDPSLARGHFGYAFELGLRAIPAGFRGRLSRRRPKNRPFFEAIDGLIACYEALHLPEQAAEVRRVAERLDGPGPGEPRAPRRP